MKLKTRLIIAFLVIIFVPLTLTIVAMVGFSQYQIGHLENTLGVTGVTYENLSDSMQVLNKATQSNYEEMKQQAQEDPEIFLNTDYLDKVNTELKDKYSYLLIRKDGKLYYSGTDKNVSTLFEELPDAGDVMTQSDSGVYIGKDIQAFVKQLDMSFADRSEGSAFIITGFGSIMPQMRALLRDIFFTIVVILILTSAMLTMWIYNGVSAPLTKLSTATKNIKEGNLDFVLESEGDDEISALCRDFEEMRQRLRDSAEEKVQYDRENKELISNIAHDLKTPITAVKGYAEGIIDGVADTPEKMDKYVRTIYNKANDMDRLINELTFYSKIDTNRIPYTFSKINITEYFDDCIEEVGLDLESKNIDLSYFNYVDKDVQIIADAEQLKRVINNIIGNSIKYLDKPKGYISIRVKDVGDFVQVEIEDNGRGIASKDQPAIFDRFYRADVSRNSAKGGSGIGLSIVKKIIEDHGGKIWVNSKLGAGTIMYFVLRKYQEVPVNE